MNNSFFESLSEQAKKFYGPVVDVNKVLLKNAERLTEYSLSTVKNYAEFGLSHLREAAQVHDAGSLSAFSAKQAELLNKLSKQALEDAQRLTELGSALREDLTKVAGESYAQTAGAFTAASGEAAPGEKAEKPARAKPAA